MWNDNSKMLTVVNKMLIKVSFPASGKVSQPIPLPKTYSSIIKNPVGGEYNLPNTASRLYKKIMKKSGVDITVTGQFKGDKMHYCEDLLKTKNLVGG